MKAFALPKYRHLRGILFLVFGLCGIAPCFHSTFFHGIEYSFSKEMFIRVYRTCPLCEQSNNRSEHGQGPNAKFDIDGCSLLYWSCFLHNQISRIVLAWKIQSYLSITPNFPCARRVRCISTGVCHNSSSKKSFNRGRHMSC